MWIGWEGIVVFLECTQLDGIIVDYVVSERGRGNDLNYLNMGKRLKMKNN